MIFTESQIDNINRLQKLADSGSLKTKKITKITKRHYVGKVYDIQVGNTNCYKLNNIFSSNSAGGSLVVYLLGISNIDPLVWELSFDRFLAESRGGFRLNTSMPKPVNF
jgi:hypothetical protein